VGTQMIIDKQVESKNEDQVIYWCSFFECFDL